MSTFLELRTDAFADNINARVDASAPYPAFRRPLRGIEIKEDRYATIMIKQANGMPIALTDAGSRAGANAGQSTTAAGGVAASTTVLPKLPLRTSTQTSSSRVLKMCGKRRLRSWRLSESPTCSSLVSVLVC